MGDEESRTYFKEITNEERVIVHAIGELERVVGIYRFLPQVFPKSFDYCFPISKPDEKGEFYGSLFKEYKGLISIAHSDYLSEDAKTFLAENKPLIVSTDIRFPDFDMNKRSGLEFILENRHLSPDSYYVFHGKHISEKDKAELKKHGFERYFIWGRMFPSHRAKKVIIEILDDYVSKKTINP